MTKIMFLEMKPWLHMITRINMLTALMTQMATYSPNIIVHQNTKTSQVKASLIHSPSVGIDLSLLMIEDEKLG